jgi:hypothetical protein
MTANPYLDNATSVETLATERTVIVDPVTGATVTIGARIERLRVDPSGTQVRDVTNLVASSADGQQLLFPYRQALFACGCCGAKPLVHATRCASCGRHMCDACRVITSIVICQQCDAKPFWLRVWEWLTTL